MILTISAVGGVGVILWTLATIVICTLVFRFYGKSGLLSVLLLAGILLAKGAISHFLGRMAEWVFVGIFGALCVTIYILRRRNQG